MENINSYTKWERQIVSNKFDRGTVSKTPLTNSVLKARCQRAPNSISFYIGQLIKFYIAVAVGI